MRHFLLPCQTDGFMLNRLSQNKACSVSYETTEYVKIGYTLNGRQGRLSGSVKIGSNFVFLDKGVAKL
jgi:hypothetical protein